MSSARQSIFCLLTATTVLATVLAASAQILTTQISASKKISSVSTAQILLPPTPPSPVIFFRNLLAMSPKERGDLLTNRPPMIRTRILAKLREYELLPPDERELRLQATELRWYLMPLLQLPPTNREERVALVPENLRPLVQDRLRQWDILPPPLKQEFLANEQTLHYFSRVEISDSAIDPNPAHAQIAEQFNRFFELTPIEKEKALNTLSAAERAQMEKTLATFDKLPPPQRMLCVRNYAKFAGMNAAERAEFLQNAQRWSEMTPDERQTWRDLVSHVPQWPPLPPSIIPPNLIPHATPHTPPKISRTNVATN